MTVYQPECDKPGCTAKAEKEYTGKHDNTLSLCERHYYRLVSGDSSTPSILNPTVTNPSIDTITRSTTNHDWTITGPVED